MAAQVYKTNAVPRVRVVHVVTSHLAVALMRGQLQFLREQGFDVTLISSPGKWLDTVSRMENVQVIGLPMAREIAPLKDLVSLWRLWRIMRRLDPDITNVSTPKAGLLAGCAAWLAGVPLRYYTLRGLRFETSTGFRRRLLVFAERIACDFAHRLVCVSPSLREKAIAFGLASSDRTVVFAAGSSNGVDSSRFAPTLERTKRAAELRSELHIPPQAPVLGFVGRLTRDKGISELVESFLRLHDQFPDLRLVVVGSVTGDSVSGSTHKVLDTHPHIIVVGQTPNTAPYYALMDILVLPSHREGFPNVVLEAYAAGKPVVAARATGSVDAVVDGETGFLFPVADVAALVTCLQRLLSDAALAKRFGAAGQELIERKFRPEMVWKALNEEYRRRLQTRRSPRPILSLGERASGSQTTNE